MDDVKLKRCPYCGSGDVEIITLQHPRYAESYAVECLDCGVMTWPTISRELAAHVWNRRAEQTWIPVTERLPRPGEDVVIRIAEDGAEEGYCTCGRYNHDRKEWVPDVEEASGDAVTHWLPIPAPPKED